MRCPGQDQRYWTADDIFDLRCPYCGYEIEFWKDEPFRMCKGCSREIRNPRMNLGCAKWCQNADACLGRSAGEGDTVAAPLVERLAAALEMKLADDDRLEHARSVCSCVDLSLAHSTADPLTAKAVAFLAGAFWAPPPLSNDATEPLLEAVLELAEVDEENATRIRQSLAEVSSDSPAHAESHLVLTALAKPR